MYSGRDRREISFCKREGLARGAVGHVGQLFASGFDVGVEFEYVLDESTVLLVLAPERDDIATLAELSTCGIAVGERLFAPPFRALRAVILFCRSPGGRGRIDVWRYP